jgi:FkbM family methyltransferase
MGFVQFIKKQLHHSLYEKAYTRAVYQSLGICIQECKVAWKQFFTWRYPVYSFFRTLLEIKLAILRLLAGRSARYSYAHTGEDRIIEAILKPQIHEPGFYVEVGCNEPVFISNTYSFYKKGWKGICIDANPAMIHKYAKKRPNDIAIAALVSNHIKERPYYIYTNNVLSSTELVKTDAQQDPGFKVEQTLTLTTQTLTNLLNKHQAPTHFDFLSIDAEEHDFEVLQSLDLTLYQPKLIIVEDESYSTQHADQNPIRLYLQQHDYECIGHVLKNVYYLKK